MADINKSDIINDKAIVAAFENVNEAIKESSKLIISLIGDMNRLNTSLSNAKGMKDLIKLNDDYAKSQKEASNAQQHAIDLQVKEAQTRESVAKAVLAEKQAIALETKESKAAQREADKRAKDLAKEVSLYSQLSKKHTEARNSAKEMAVQYGVNSKEFKKAADEANKLDKELKKIDSSLGQNQRNVGNYTKAIELVKIGWAAVGAAVIAAGKYILDINTKFSKSSASLKAITGATNEDMKFFEAQAKSMGKAFGIAGDEMLKSFERVGSIRPELLKTKEALVQVTQSAIVLSQASGGILDLTGATEALGAGMNQFNLSAKDSDKIINALAAGSQIGSAEVSSLAESFKNVGAVANNANMSLEDTVAALEVLGEKSLYGSEAGTKLRGTILKLQEAGKGFASGKFNLKDALTETKNELDAIANPMEKATYLQKMFGIENQTAGIIMVQNIDKYTKFREGVEGTNTAFEQQKIQMDTISGSWDRLASTWDSILTSGWFQASVKWMIDGTNWLLKWTSSAAYVDAAMTDLFEGIENATPEEKIKKITDRLKELHTTGFIDNGSYRAEQVERLEAELDKLNGTIQNNIEIEKIAAERAKLSSINTTELLLKQTDLQKIAGQLGLTISENEKQIGFYDVSSRDALETTKLQIKAIDEEIASRNKQVESVTKQVEAVSKSVELTKEERKAIEERNKEMRERDKESQKETDKRKLNTFDKTRFDEIDVKKISDKEISELEDRLKQKEALNEEYTQRELERYQEVQEIKKQLANDAVSTGKDLINTMFEVQQANYDREIQLIEDRTTAQLDNENLTESQRKQIEAQRDADVLKVEQKKRESQRKQFITNKAIALAEIAINTAKGIAATIGKAGFLGIPLSVLVGALGAAQAAVVLAQPMPAFDKGTDNAPNTPFLVGEVRPEFVTHNGKTQLVTEPTVMTNMGGAVITSGAETQRILEANQQSRVRNSFSHKTDVISYKEMVNETRELRRDIRNQKPVQVYAGQNVTTYTRRGQDLLIKKLRG